MAKNTKPDMSCARVKQYQSSDIGSCERHNERMNESYDNINVVPERIDMNVHYKSPYGKSYMDILRQMEADGKVSTRGLRQDATLFDEIIIDVNTMYFERKGGYEYAKEFYAEAYRFIEEKFGADNVISAVMHADEINRAVSPTADCHGVAILKCHSSAILSVRKLRKRKALGHRIAVLPEPALKAMPILTHKFTIRKYDDGIVRYICTDDKIRCPHCGGKMHVHDYVARRPITRNGTRWKCLIPRFRCLSESCKQRYYRVIPIILMPYKQYESDIVEAVIDGKEDENSLCVTDGPAEPTIIRWRKWFCMNRFTMEAELRRNLSGIAELSSSVLSETKSLIDRIQSFGKHWLPFLLCPMYALGRPPGACY